MVPGGDLALAKECLERVAQSNVEEVTLAAEMLKKLEATLLTRPVAADPS